MARPPSIRAELALKLVRREVGPSAQHTTGNLGVGHAHKADMNGITVMLLRAWHPPSKRCSIACRRILWCLVLLGILGTRAFSQTDSPIALRSAARALTLEELSGVTERAKSGDSQSQVLLGLRLRLTAEHVAHEKDSQAGYASSIYWLRKAANEGSAAAEYYLASTELELTGTSSWKLVDCKEVSLQLNKAIAQDYAPAMTELGRQYIGTAGCASQTNEALALYWFKKAYSAGDPEAAYEIGMAYDGSDHSKADQWFLNGANLGDASSQNAIGVNLAAGIGTRKNVREAAEWFRKSAEQGSAYGSCNFALDYMRGEGIAKNLVLSLEWVLISDQTNENGTLCGDEIDIRPFLKLTPAQEAEATRQANAWLEQHHYPLAEPPNRKCTDCNPLTGNVDLVQRRR